MEKAILCQRNVQRCSVSAPTEAQQVNQLHWH